MTSATPPARPPETPGAAAASRRSVGRWVALGAQLALAVALAWAFHLESPAFYLRILPLTVGGALVHHALPPAYRPWFFAALGIAGLLIVLGPRAGGWLGGVGLTLVGLCHLPVSFRWRLAVVVLAVVSLMMLRAGWAPAPWPGVVWPVMGSIFMFRLGLYLYDLAHRREPAEPGLILSYFFLLPNAVFLLFPVIDYRTFRRTYYDRPALDIYEEGARWILRGFTHLVLYRVIYQHAVIAPAEVVTTAGLVRYLVSNFGLYLRVSGQFHLIVGMLHLYGFRLPETHRFFYLASSVTDLWRRINIYWKDFMQQTVYLPVVLRLQRRGETPALVGGTVSVVVATWALHSYQWFWLLGRWLVSAPDMIFWSLLGLLLLANTLWEQRRGRARQLTARGSSTRAAWTTAVQTAGMFALMSMVWGAWTAETLPDFWVMLGAVTLRGRDAVAVGGVLGAITVAAYVSRRSGLAAPSALATRRWWQHPLVSAALPLGALWLVGEPVLAARLPASIRSIALASRQVELNSVDADRLQRGYYEDIVGVERTNGELWELYARTEQDEGPAATDNAHKRLTDAGDGLGNRGYAPNLTTMFLGGRFSTNRWGMRDRDYELTPPPATRRMAVLGPSYVVGSGVNDGETFEALVEDRLNQEWSVRTGLRYEVLNFSLHDATLVEEASILGTDRVRRFKPDLVLLVSPLEMEGSIGVLFWKKMQRRQGFQPFEERWRRTLGLTRSMPLTEVQRRARPYETEMVRSGLEAAASAIRGMGATPVFAIVPLPRFSTPDPTRQAALIALAGQYGFVGIDMQDTFAGLDPGPLELNGADRHPNAAGHRVIANRLFTELVKRPALLAARGTGQTVAAGVAVSAAKP